MRSRRRAARALVVVTATAVAFGVLPGTAWAAPKNRVSINDVTVAENGAQASFTITYSGPSRAGTVVWATAPGTATAGADYTTSSGTASLPAGGCRCATVSVPIANDALDEPDETFFVNLSSYSAGQIQDGQGVATITDDDPAPSLVVSDAETWEGGGALGFDVTLSAPSGKTVSVGYATANGTATAGSDYQAASGTLSFPPGTTTRTVSVTILADGLVEPTETFTLSLSSPTNATIADGTGTGTIVDDDVEPTVSVGDASGVEGGPIAFAVTLSGPYEASVTVDVGTLAGTASEGTDYEALGTTITFDPGTTSKTVQVTTLEDAIDEPDETFTLSLSSPTNATIADADGAGTILDDDRAPGSLTLKARATRTKVVAFGIAEPATSTTTVRVQLQRREGTRWKTVAKARARVSQLGDRDADAYPDGQYKASFRRPASGRYRVVAVLPATAEATGATRTVSLRL
jgi:hypothetical protein